MSDTKPTTGCPVSASESGSVRKVHRPGEVAEPRVEFAGDRWHIRSAEAVRQVLRERDATTQAGFNAETINRSGMRQPILFMDGEDHRTQRSKIARYFAPKTVDARYRSMMEAKAEALVSSMAARGVVDLATESMRYSVDVAAQVVGLTESDTDAMAKRLGAFFQFNSVDPEAHQGIGDVLVQLVRGRLPMLHFFIRDVLPAIRAKRRKPEDDVISYLLAEGYRNHEILIECVTYGAAGMVTTREFISMATWHLLQDDPLRERYLAAEQRERYAILHEILRLEPIVGHLYRRTTRDLSIRVGEQEYLFRAGSLLDLYIRQANSDPATVGDNELGLCPGRQLPRGYGGEVESFGDGAHKCPGNSVAIQESDILLTRLLAHPLTILSEPRIAWDDLIAGYELRDFVIKLAA